jgi:SAM-dependent methyltransferase
LLSTPASDAILRAGGDMTSQADFIRYLAAKTSVDDRALNAGVWHRLRDHLPPATPAAPRQVLEVGGGIGTMLQRLVGRRLLGPAHYRLLDADPAVIAAAAERLAAWAAAQGYAADPTSRPTADGHRLTLRVAGAPLVVDLAALDLHDELAARDDAPAWDLLIAHAVLDLLDVPTVLPRLARSVRPGGLLYLTINFDGATLFEPAIDPPLDALIERLYHQTMDQRVTAGRPSGDSRTGRHLFGHLRAAGLAILAAGGSDWVVFAGPGGYPADEAFFLRFIVETVRGALAGAPGLDQARFAAWIAERQAQIDRGDLVYIAHQLDFLAQRPSSPAAP